MNAAVSFVLRFLLVLAIVEGASSLLLLTLVVPVQIRPPLAERRHTQYDEELGWVNVRGLYAEDIYGAGVSLTVNSQGFRNRRDFPVEVPEGKVRIICSGDSFTLGYGVADDQTWCARLASLDPRLETVNMGQGGYGVDQAYLWYARDGAFLDHQIQVFAFIVDDFRRMQDDSFLGYGKPVLRVQGGRLVTENVPVPSRGYRVPWLTQNLDLLTELRSLELLRAVIGSSSTESAEDLGGDEFPELVWTVFEKLRRMNREKGSRLVLVYLPMISEVEVAVSDPWREFLRQQAAARGIPFLDLVEWIRKLPREQIPALFIPEGVLAYPAAAGHYSARGNEWVARQLYARLRRLLASPSRPSDAPSATPSPGS
jgi:hypothetical protein